MGSGFITFDGTAGNHVTTPDLNLLDADTAHVYQSKGEWSVGTVVTDEPSQFGSSAIEYEWPASGQKYWQTITTSQAVTPSADYAASVTFKVATAASLVDEQARLILDWRDVGDSNLSFSYGSFVSVSDDGWVTLTETGTAPVGSDHCRLIVNFNVGTTVVCSIGSACLRAGSDSSFVPSLRIVANDTYTKDPSGLPAAFTSGVSLKIADGFTGDAKSVVLQDGAAGPEVANCDMTVLTPAEIAAAEFVSTDGRTYTINGAAWVGVPDGSPSLMLLGVG